MAETSIDEGAAPAAAGGPRGFFSPLRNWYFRRLWLGESISLLGDQFYLVALPWLTLQLTGSGLALGTVLMAAAIPRLLFMLVGGALADRISPRPLLLGSNAVRMVLAALLAVLAWAGALSLGLLYLFAFAFGVADAFFQPAMLAIVPGLVDPDELEPSNALLQATGQASEIVGPLAAGLVIATGAIWYAFAIDALSFLFAAVMLLGVRVVRPAAEASAEPEAPGLVAELLAGLRTVWRDPAMRIFLLVIAGLNFFMIGPVNAGLPALAALRFGASAGAFGTMLTLFGVGALLGTLAAGALRIGGRMGLMLPAFTGLIGLALIGLGSAPSVLVACAMCAAIGFGISFVNIHILSWLQRRTPPELLGRVMSVVVAAALGLDPFSRAVAGLAIDWSTSAMFAVAGAGILAITLLAASSRAVRSIG